MNYLIKSTILLLTTSIGFTVGCTTVQKGSLVAKQKPSTYTVDAVSVDLKQKYVYPEFYTQDELAAKLKTCIQTQLTDMHKLSTNDASGAGLTVVVNYQRIFSGEGFGNLVETKAVTRPHFDYQVSAKNKDSKEVLFSKKIEGMTTNSGLLGNLKTVLTMDLTNKNKESEDVYLTAICRGVVEAL